MYAQDVIAAEQKVVVADSVFVVHEMISVHRAEVWRAQEQGDGPGRFLTRCFGGSVDPGVDEFAHHRVDAHRQEAAQGDPRAGDQKEEEEHGQRGEHKLDDIETVYRYAVLGIVHVSFHGGAERSIEFLAFFGALKLGHEVFSECFGVVDNAMAVDGAHDEIRGSRIVVAESPDLWTGMSDVLVIERFAQRGQPISGKDAE